MKKCLIFCLCAVAGVGPSVTLLAGGSTPQDVVPRKDIEKMTDSEKEFAGKLSGEAAKAFIQMDHAERASAMNMVNMGNGSLSANEAVLIAFKKRPAKV